MKTFRIERVLVAAVVVLSLTAGAVRVACQEAQPTPEEEEQALIALLQSDGEPFEKDVACRRLAVIGTEKAVPALAALLSDDALCGIARHGLEGIPDAAADVALRAAMAELEGLQLIGVIDSIGVRGDGGAVADLAELLAGADQMVAAAAAASLGKIGDEASATALQVALAEAGDDRKAAVADACVSCALVMFDRDEDGPALALCDAVREADVPMHLVAAGTRHAILEREAGGLPLLVRQLRSDEVELFEVALTLAREMPGARATKAMATELGKLPDWKQVLLIQALGDRGDVGALPAIAEAAGDDATGVRVAALVALGQLGDASVVPLLFAAAASPEEEVAGAAQATLASLPGDGVDEAILGALSEGDAETRSVAIAAAGQRRIAEANPALLEAADDADGSVRAAAIKALGETGGADETAALAELLVGRGNDEELALAEATIAAVCSRLTDLQPCADELLARLPDAETPAACAVLRSLRSAPVASALDAVRGAAQDADATIQETGIGVLCDWPSADAAPDLLELAKASPDAGRKTRGLHGYMRLVGAEGLATDQRMAMCDEAAQLVQSDDDKRRLLDALSVVPAAEALAMAMSHLETAPLTNKASWSAVTIGEKIMQDHPAEVAAAMKKVLDTMDNPGMARRVRAAMNQARQAAGQ